MRSVISLALLALLALLAWQVGSRLSTDAVGMGVGLVFGVMAGVPVALLISLAGGAGRLGESPDDAYARGFAAGVQAEQLEMLRLGTKPAWMVEAQPSDGYRAAHRLALPVTERRFLIVDEADE